MSRAAVRRALVTQVARGLEMPGLLRAYEQFTRAADLVRTLTGARDSRELGRLQRRLMPVDLLSLDEPGFVPFDRAGGELLFDVVVERYERPSVVVTTNLAFAEWVKVFGGDEKLTTAVLDRLAHHAAVSTTKGKSCGMRKRSPRAGSQAEGSSALCRRRGQR